MSVAKEFICSVPDDLQEVIDFIKPNIKQGVCIVLKGSLGAGKTEFVRRYLRSVGVKSNIVSPTFTYFEKYETIDYNFYHFDLYRLSSEEDFFLIGGEEILYDDNICFIEWPEIIEDLFVESKTIKIEFEVTESSRHIKVKVF